MAPEIKNGEIYNHKIDIWALGLVLLELVNPLVASAVQLEAGRSENSDSQILEIFEKTKFTAGSLRGLLINMLRYNPSERYDIE